MTSFNFPFAAVTRRWSCLVLGLGASLSGAWAQSQPATPAAALAAQHRLDPYEKLFLHLDRRTYVGGDLLWFKAYVVEGTRQRPLALSKVAYVEVLNGQHQPVVQAKVALRDAQGHGTLALPGTLPSGTYTVRAYTSLMKNFGPDAFFHSTITVLNTFSTAPARAAADSAGYDVQFFPEGGSLVSGLSSRVGVKITDRAGHGIEAEGEWQDAQGKVVARFTTYKYGMGHFDVQPTQAGAAYTAVVRLPHEQTLTRPAPAVLPQGYVLRLDTDPAGKLVLTVQGRATADGGRVSVLGHARQHVFLTQQSSLSNGQLRVVLPADTLPEGVLHFTVFDEQQRPVAERLYFRRPTARLTLTTQTAQARYATRSKVDLELLASTPKGQPALAQASVAVYRLDQLSTTAPDDILTSLWLSSELRGPVEDATYYLRTTDPEAADNLMLTQGWRRFRWAELQGAGAPALRYLPELNGHFVEGRVVRNSAGVAGIGAFLAVPGRPIRLYPAVSHADGRVRFEVPEYFGPRPVVALADGRQDSTCRVELLSPFAADYAPWPARPLAPIREWQTDLTRRHVQVQAQTAFFNQRMQPFAAPLADSSAFYGKPDETYRLDDYTRFPTLEDVMREYVPGVQVRRNKQNYRFLVVDKPNRQLFSDNPLVLIDGLPVFSINRVMKVDPLKIKRLDVVTNQYLHGPLVYNGLVSYTTYRGDAAGLVSAPAAGQEYEGLQWEREFYAPRYETPAQQQSRLLDLRNLLYWNPGVTTTGGRRQLDFYTSDEPGTYQVVVQGLTADGLAGSGSFTFEVVPSSLAQGK